MFRIRVLQAVRIWDARTGELLERLQGHRDSVYSVAFTPDERGLVSGSLDKTLKYWDVSRLVNGPGGRPNSPRASKRDSMNGKKDAGTREGNSACTMNFIGHKVCTAANWLAQDRSDCLS